jgi:hypothetical protein
MFTHARTSLILLALTVCASSVVASPINIDTFDSGDTAFGIFGITSDFDIKTPLPAAETISEDRMIFVDTTGTTGMGSADAIVAGGKLSLGTNTAILPYSATWLLHYGKYLNADLVDDDGAPNTGILVEFVSAEHEYELIVRAWGDGVPPEFATISRSLPANTSPHDVFLPFNQFTTPTGFTFTEVDQLEVELRGVADGDYELDRISANVPEPGTLILLTAGAGFVVRRRRRRK